MTLTGAKPAPWSRQDMAAAIGGLVTGLLTGPAQSLVDTLHLVRALGGFAMALGGVPFAILIVAVARMRAQADWWRALSLGFVVVVVFEVAIVVSANISMSLTDWNEITRNILAGLVGGLVGTALLGGGAFSLGIGPRRFAVWLPMVAAGTVLGVLLAIDAYRQAENAWLLFPLWQAVVALLFARAVELAAASSSRTDADHNNVTVLGH